MDKKPVINRILIKIKGIRKKFILDVPPLSQEQKEMIANKTIQYASKLIAMTAKEMAKK